MHEMISVKRINDAGVDFDFYVWEVWYATQLSLFWSYAVSKLYWGLKYRYIYWNNMAVTEEACVIQGDDVFNF